MNALSHCSDDSVDIDASTLDSFDYSTLVSGAGDREAEPEPEADRESGQAQATAADLDSEGWGPGDTADFHRDMPLSGSDAPPEDAYGRGGERASYQL